MQQQNWRTSGGLQAFEGSRRSFLAEASCLTGVKGLTNCLRSSVGLRHSGQRQRIPATARTAGMLDLVMNLIGPIPIRMETKVDFGLLRSTASSESASAILGFLPELAQETQHCLDR